MTALQAPRDVVTRLWTDAALDPSALERLTLSGQEPALPSSFAVGTAAQASLAVAALAASEIGRARNGLAQGVTVPMQDAAMECLSWFSIDGRTPPAWDKLSGLYRCADGWVRVHANFAHHRDGVLRLLGLAEGPDTPRSAVEAALVTRSALAFEQAAADANLVVAAVRTQAEWDAHPQGQAVVSQPLLVWEKLGEAPPQPWAPLAADQRPLSGLRVLDLTRILAGPICGRTLAAYGADVLLVNSPQLPNIESIIETSRGKLSCLLDLDDAAAREQLRGLLAGADVFIQGYRPGGLAERGFGPADAARLRPGIVCVSLSAYGQVGPWSGRRAFDSLVQSASGFNDAERIAAGGDTPKALPTQILDCATGFLMAFAAQAGRLRQAREGGSWLVRLSLAQTGHWVRGLGSVTNGMAFKAPPVADFVQAFDSGWGQLVALRHAARFSDTPAGWDRPSVRPGSHAAAWPGRPGDQPAANPASSS